MTTSAERYCNGEQKYKIMKSYFSIKPGATFVELSKVSQIPDDIVDKIQHFETEVLANKGNEENDFGKYYSVMYTGTNSRGARIKRAGLFCKYCLAT